MKNDKFIKYPHIPNLETMKPNPRILLGKILWWTEKFDGSCMALWMKNNQPHLSSRNMKIASEDLQNFVKSTEEYPKLLSLLNDNPEYIIYFEACRKGRSVTGIDFYDKNFCIVFDIFNRATNNFLPYIFVYQQCYHYKIPVVPAYAKTRHRTFKDLLKFRNHILEYCQSIHREGMVIKTFMDKEGESEYIMAKVKLDVPRPTKEKIAKGQPIYPPIPDSEVLNCIDKVWQELGTEKFKDVKLAMPKIAEEVKKACKEHYYRSNPKKLYNFYKQYLERMIT